MSRASDDLATRLLVRRARIHELLERLRVTAVVPDADRCDWIDVDSMAELAARLAELVSCRACNGTGYAAGRCPHPRRDRHDGAAHAPCSACEGRGHEAA